MASVWSKAVCRCHHETDKAHRPAFRLAARRNDPLSAQAHLRLDELLGIANIHDFAVRTPCNDEGRGFYERCFRSDPILPIRTAPQGLWGGSEQQNSYS